MSRKHQGGIDSGQRQEKQGGGSEKRYQIDCRESSPDCTLKFSGSMEEVIATGEMHGRKVHSMRGSEEEVRRQLKQYVREEGARDEEKPKAEAGAAGGRNEERPDMPPA